MIKEKIINKNYNILKTNYWDFPDKESSNNLQPTDKGNITPLGKMGRSYANKKYPKDIEGFPIKNKNMGYTPVRITQQCFRYLFSYHLTNNEEYLLRVKKFTKKIIENSQLINDALYFPYNFNYNLHGIKNQKLKSPWYSGMSQGQILSLMVRMYNTTKEPLYKKNADLIFNSFKNLKEYYDPWVVYVDKNNYYWIEEYPMEQPCNTLNGFIFGIFGLYDYYWLNPTEETLLLLNASITTIEKYISKFRNNSKGSFYCLKHKVKSNPYHQIHIHQLKMLYKLTGENYFLMEANKFKKLT